MNLAGPATSWQLHFPSLSQLLALVLQWLLSLFQHLLSWFVTYPTTAASSDVHWWEQPRQVPARGQHTAKRQQLLARDSAVEAMVRAPAAQQPDACAQCQVQPGNLKCGRCKTVGYCGKACQVAHWKAGHKLECGRLLAACEAVAQAQPAHIANGKRSSTEEDQDELAPVPEKVLYAYAKFLRFMRPDAVGMCSLPPVGLRNVGNTCFANALLQCLLHTRPLVAYLLSGAHMESCARPSRQHWCLLCEMQQLAQQVYDAQQQQQQDGTPMIVNPRAITGSLRRIATHFIQGRQEDSHDLYLAMLDQMESVLLHEAGGKAAIPDVRTRETTLLGHCFTGYVCFQTMCPACGWISQRYDTKVEFELEFSCRTPTLEAFLASSFADEQLDDDNLYKCGHCKQMVRATRHSCIEVAPNVLVLCLKRFGKGRYSKINQHVAYQDTVDLSNYRAKGAIDTAPATYQLYGVLVHQDTMNLITSGHYVSYVRADDGRWFLCNDSSIRQVSESEALSQNAYMLFYQRDEARPAPDPSQKKVLVPGTCPTRKAAPIHLAAKGHMAHMNGHKLNGGLHPQHGMLQPQPAAHVGVNGKLERSYTAEEPAQCSMDATELQAEVVHMNGWHHDQPQGTDSQAASIANLRLRDSHSLDISDALASDAVAGREGPYVFSWRGAAQQQQQQQALAFAGQCLSPQELQLQPPPWSCQPAFILKKDASADAAQQCVQRGVAVSVQLPGVCSSSELRVSVWRNQLLVASPQHLLPLVLPDAQQVPDSASCDTITGNSTAQGQGQAGDGALQSSQGGQARPPCVGYEPSGEISFNTRSSRLKIRLLPTSRDEVFQTSWHES